MAHDRSGRLPAIAVAIAGVALAAGTGAAQEQDTGQPTERVVPTNAFVLTGYGTVGWGYQPDGDQNAFLAGFNPIFLYQFQDRFLFEAELEFELQEGVTETGLEYAQLDWVALNNVTLVGGKFLLPFGVFGQRLHPTWINKFPSPPPIYGHHIAQFGVEALLPVLSDLGVLATGTITPGDWQLSLNGYVTQGPAVEMHEEEPAEPMDPDLEIPEIGFPGSTGDNNTGKMVGGRLDVAMPPWFEVNGSFITGDYDDEGVLNFKAWNVAGEFHYSRFEARGELLQTRQEFETLEGFPQLVRTGFYTQAAYRLNQWEPVLRWTQVFDDKVEGEVVGEGASQTGIGLNYWIAPSIAIMAGYEINREKGTEIDNDRFIIHLAFGY